MQMLSKQNFLTIFKFALKFQYSPLSLYKALLPKEIVYIQPRYDHELASLIK